MSDALLVSIILVGGMFFLMAIGVSVSVAIGLPSAISLVILQGADNGLYTSAQKIFNGMNNFLLLAIPFFVLAGVIMNNGGIAERLINLAKVTVGFLPAHLSHTNVVANMLFGSISGSALAGAAAIGSTMAPAQRKEGYDMGFAAAANVASAPSGMLIPPSNTLLVYTLVSQTSVAAVFLAGYIPGILWALTCMAVVAYYAKKRGMKRSAQRPAVKEIVTAFLRAIPSLLLVIIVIGGIVGGAFTATEGSVIAVLYALVLSFIYRSIKVRDLWHIILNATRTSAVVIFLIGLSTIMSYVMTFSGIPRLIAEAMKGWTDNKYVFLLIMAVILLIIGIPLDATPAVLIFTPIFLPIAVEYGVHPIHFGIMMVFNMCIAVISPPSAPVLFVGAKVAGLKVESVIGALMPYFGALILMLFVVQYIPALSLWIPDMAGYIYR